MTARRLLALILTLTPVAGPAVAEDVAVIATGGEGVTKVGGRIVDYTGDGLVLELPGGRRQTFPADKVRKLSTRYDSKQLAADAALARNDFQQALTLYRQARTVETRLWVKRLITARMVWCCRGLGQPGPAGEEFLLLVRSDPTTPYFDCIPLAWVPRQPSSSLDRTARAWLAREDMPAAVLLGASHLLPTAARADAIARLKQLTTSSDRRIAQLALAETWRAEVATADEQRLAAWRRTIESMPESLRAGPYYVLGLGWAHQGHWEEAALALLRTPILFPRDRRQAAQCLLDAGRSLERLDRPAEAARLYHELIETYSETRPVAEARGRLAEMAKE